MFAPHVSLESCDPRHRPQSVTSCEVVNTARYLDAYRAMQLIPWIQEKYGCTDNPANAPVKTQPALSKTAREIAYGFMDPPLFLGYLLVHNAFVDGLAFHLRVVHDDFIIDPQ